jgi:NAD(P)-dependent dehydrogenase (short-subunit alcohol dehydrogenase family)
MAVRPLRVVIIGAGGAIGAALVQSYLQLAPPAQVLACSRQPLPLSSAAADWMALDLLDERSIAAAAAHAAAPGPVDRILICSGLLHDAERRPEKSLRELDAAWLQRNFAINSIGPALVLKHFLPVLRRDERAVCAALSARVGSIGDNRLGGWYSYRASKAALNMLIATAAIELKRTHPKALLIGLHPGTVDSPLSAPYQTNLREGQLQTPLQAAAQLLQVVESADAGLSGRCLAWDGSVVPA